MYVLESKSECSQFTLALDLSAVLRARMSRIPAAGITAADGNAIWFELPRAKP